MTDKKFRLTIHHDDDSSYLNPNEEDSPLFRLHSFNTRHISFTDPDTLLGCQFEYPEKLDKDGFVEHYAQECGYMPTNHEPVDHEYQGPEGYMLSYFEHGQCKWGLAGSMTHMPDFRWDGVQFAGFLEVVVPDDEREWWNGRPEADKGKAAEAFVETYTDWCNGEVYGYTLEKLNPRTCDLGYVHEENEDMDSCWGFIGFESIQEEVQGTTYLMGATEENTEIVDQAYGSAEYGRWFVTEKEGREIDERMRKVNV